MSANQANVPVATMARVLGVSPAGYYAWCRRAPSARAISDAALLKRIRTIHAISRETYGAPRIHAELRAEGQRISRKRVARLMRQAGLEGVSRRKGTRTTQRDKQARPAPDLVDRHFTAAAPNRLWVADLTYVKTHRGWVYVAFVVDACSRFVVGWQASRSLRTDLALDALEMALWTRRAVPLAGLIHHSDRGVQYLAIRYTERLAEAGVVP